MGNKWYVGLPYRVTDGQMQEIFAAHGIADSFRVITDKFTGQASRFGFVGMVSGGEAQKVNSALNGIQLDGPTLVRNEALPHARRERGGRKR